MEPRIQYAKTTDGVSIAYWTLGEGEPLVLMPPLNYSHLQLEWQFPEVRLWYERLAETRMIVRYDIRGVGLSERKIRDYSMTAMTLDLDAVADRLGLETFALMGFFTNGPIAIAYAVRRPARVSRLILWCSLVRNSEFVPQSALLALSEQDWETFTETMAHMSLGWSEGRQAHEWAGFIRASVAQETQLAHFAEMEKGELDADSLLPQVEAPTLVMQRSKFLPWGLDPARELASRIPDARLIVLEGKSPAPYAGDAETALQAIDEFMGIERRVPHRKETLPQGTAVILFADIVDSTALTERLGDAAFRAKARDLAVSLRALIRECSGTPVEGPTLGDGVLAAFTSAREAIEAARRCAKAGDDAGLPLHLGLHAGDVSREKDPDGRDNVYGGAVNIASRISGLSAPGEVLVSETVRSLARTSAGVAFEDRGEQALKGVGEAVRVWAVREGGE